MLTESKNKLGQDILYMRYKQFQNIGTIAATLGVSEGEVREFLDKDTEARIKVFKDTPKTSDKYSVRKLAIIDFLRNEQQKNCEEIAEMLGLSQNTVYASFNSPKKSKKKATKDVAPVRITLNREEKRKRNEEILRLNVEEGLTLEAIGQRYNLTRQRISDILKEMGHIPLTGNKIKAMDKKKNKSILSKKSVDTYNEKLQDLGTELRITKQKFSLYKYYTTKDLIEVRCELMECLLLNWEHNKPVGQYKALAKVLRTNMSHFKKVKATDDICYQLLKTTLEKCDTLEKQYNI